MTADPDAVMAVHDRSPGRPSRAARGHARRAAGRAAKLLPPSDPLGTLARPDLEQRLARRAPSAA